jgi:tRNA threonylcarbamoyl adenosine modification protein (Sua5/YciO/YrdC/YwlC family)
MILRVHPENPQPRAIASVVDILTGAGIIIYPTDTIYGLGCDIFKPDAIERICHIKKIDPRKAQFSFVCYDLSHLSDFAKQISTPVFRMLREFLPGPYTFILPASKLVPRLLQSKKNTIGLRIPDNLIARTIVKELGNPVLSTSLPGEMIEDYTDPEIMFENFGREVDVVVDGGIGGSVPSTVIDCTGKEPLLLRQGLGAWDH